MKISELRKIIRTVIKEEKGSIVLLDATKIAKDYLYNIFDTHKYDNFIKSASGTKDTDDGSWEIEAKLLVPIALSDDELFNFLNDLKWKYYTKPGDKYSMAVVYSNGKKLNPNDVPKVIGNYYSITWNLEGAYDI